MVLERKIQAMEESLEVKEAQLTEVLKGSNLDSATLRDVTEKIEDVVQQVTRTLNQTVKLCIYDCSQQCIYSPRITQ